MRAALAFACLALLRLAGSSEGRAGAVFVSARPLAPLDARLEGVLHKVRGASLHTVDAAPPHALGESRSSREHSEPPRRLPLRLRGGATHAPQKPKVRRAEAEVARMGSRARGGVVGEVEDGGVRRGGEE
ncbi:hypothetical protein T484DRAFT_1898283, partial [Baffinella frigidus]